MYKRVVSGYVEDEIKKGKTINQVRKDLIKLGYNKEDVEEVLRAFEIRESDLRSKEDRLKNTKTKLSILLLIILVVVIINLTLFFRYSSNNYILVKETPTGLVTQTITKEELQSLEKNLNLSNSSEKTILGIT